MNTEYVTPPVNSWREKNMEQWRAADLEPGTARSRPVWTLAIPMVSDEVRAMSERAMHLEMVQQQETLAAERARWAAVLAPEMRPDGQRLITRTGIALGGGHVGRLHPDAARGVHGPYRDRSRRRRTRRSALSWCIAIVAGLAIGIVVSATGGCSLASDSRVDELVALDLQDAITTAKKATPHQSPIN